MNIDHLIQKEGWIIHTDNNGEKSIEAYGDIHPYTAPLNIHLKYYRTLKAGERKYLHMKAIHDYLWPDDKKTWHYWTERRFRSHCDNNNYIVYAGGAGTAKSADAAKIALIFWLANPEKRTVIVASTTLAGVDSRIWGYVKKLIKRIKIPLPITYTAHPNPKILYFNGKKKTNQYDNIKDTIHGMFAIAAKRGDDDEAIAGWIGRHPEDKILLILDEATDMPLSIVKAFPNLESKPDKFQLIAIGNSLSKYDLHGTLATPKGGWGSIDPMRDYEWATTQRNGICLFFSCYDSPAIHETDPERKKALSGFLLTEEELNKKIKELGKDSDAFYRFVLGFWKSGVFAEVVIDPDYVKRYGMQDSVEWSGIYPIRMVAGLDPGFTTGGDSTVLRIAALGVDIRGKMVLDFRGEKYLYRIPILANNTKSAELQIAENTLQVLNYYNIPLEHLCIDAGGAGRLLGELMRQITGGINLPLRVVPTRLGSNSKEVKIDKILVKSAYELWLAFKPFVTNEQIRGLDNTTVIQLTNRLVTVDDTTNKIRLESKAAYKRRIGNIMRDMARSPDEADGASMTLQSAITNFGFYPGQQMKIENPFMLEKMYYSQKAVQETLNPEPQRPDIRNIKADFSANLEEWNQYRKDF